jgi:mRNA interferase RelE/StbE
MVWRIELSDLARKNLKQLDPQNARRILAFLNDRIASLENPRAIGEALRGSKLGELWKYRVGDYRVGDYRVISCIEDKTVRIIVVRIGNRKDVYK